MISVLSEMQFINVQTIGVFRNFEQKKGRWKNSAIINSYMSNIYVF